MTRVDFGWIALACSLLTGVRLEAQTPEAPTVIRGGTLIDGTGREPQNDAVVVVTDDRFSAVGVRGDVEIPRDARVIEARGMFLIPGLIELHDHMTTETTFMSAIEDVVDGTIAAVQHLKLELYAGITTARDVGSMGDVPFKMRDAILRGELEGPRVFVAGEAIHATGGHGDEGYPLDKDLYLKTLKLSPYSLAPSRGKGPEGPVGPWEWRGAVRRQIHRGADLIKVMSNFTPEEIQAAVDEAHQLGFRVTTDSNTVYTKWAVEAGVDSVEHPMPRDDETIRMMAEKGIYSVPTLIAYELIFEEDGGYYWSLHRRDFFGDAGRNAGLYRERNLDVFRRMHRAGVKMGVGTDIFGDLRSQIPTNYIRELQLMVEGGYSPMEALVAATRIGAEVIGVERDIGTVEVGKLADLVVLAENPLKDFEAIRSRRLVMKDGRIFVNEIGPPAHTNDE
jgi:imidazolonepropionase-like amidohydrolase